MRIFPSRLDGALIIEPRVFGDARGFFMESWNAQRYREAGIDEQFVQDNVSRSVRGVLRGLHLQHPQGQGKLVQVLTGEVFDVAVDIRRGSPTYGQWEAVTLSEENRRQFYIPPGFAHGFVCFPIARCFLTSAPSSTRRKTRCPSAGMTRTSASNGRWIRPFCRPRTWPRFACATCPPSVSRCMSRDEDSADW